MRFSQLKKKNYKKITRPYIIAEIGVNHECSIKKAIELIDAAKEGGADAVKFQAYKAELIASKKSPAYWNTKKEKTKNQYDLFKKYDKFEYEDFYKIYKYCNSINIEFLCTPFDHNSANYLNKLVKVFKISSSDITNKPLIKLISSFNKPIILSVGASDLTEIKKALSWIKNKNKTVIMHCVLNYPTLNKNAQLKSIELLKKEFKNNIIGYSDHTLPGDLTNLTTAWLLGAKVIEKHFTVDKKKVGNDHYHSMDKKDLILFNNKIKNIIEIIGKNSIGHLSSEKISRKNARRGIYSNRFIAKGSRIEALDLICKRPSSGIEPEFFKHLIGKKIKKSLDKDRPLKWIYF
jgi:sialic acid synthase SpsE